jgi:ABC-type transport system substrate-binding protein
MARSASDRLLALELDKADFAEIPPAQARRAAERGIRLSASEPEELLALAFLAGRPAAQDARVREAVSRSLDRSSIVNFILQKEGDPAGGLLPQWSSGTAFLFTTVSDASGAKELWSQIAGTTRIVVGYDSGDSLEQAVAERVAVNAREAGIGLTAEAMTTAPGKFDARLVRLRMPSPDPREALAQFVTALSPLAGFDPTPVPDNASAEQIYEAQRGIVSSYRVVPLVWLPDVYGLSARVRDWKAPAVGGVWPLADVWLEQETP